ncbi:MAG: N-formylglutamate amidohydrolase [Deltaproteobacteria bacterium]|nr:N-formylglutamate amidohydrolase [Deltaproteobacteria bacterium]
MAGLILSVPYASPFLPKAIIKRMTLSPEELRWENWRLTDPFLLEVVKKALEPEPSSSGPSRDLVKREGASPHNLPKTLLLPYPFSPLVADPLGLLAVELGLLTSPKPFILTRGALEKDLPTWSESEKEFIFSHCVQPYVDKLVQAGQTLLAEESLVLLITIRFFSHKVWLHDHRELPKPQINLGQAAGLSPQGLTSLAGHIFRRFGLWTELDYPLAGTHIPAAMAAWPRLKALGLAIRRDLYLDETKGALKASAGSLARTLRVFFSLLGQELDRVAQVRLKRAFPPKPPSNIIKAGQLT